MTVWATRADQVDLRGPNPHDLARSVKGHENLPAGGHETCPVAATRSAHRQPPDCVSSCVRTSSIVAVVVGCGLRQVGEGNELVTTRAGTADVDAPAEQVAVGTAPVAEVALLAFSDLARAVLAHQGDGLSTATRSRSSVRVDNPVRTAMASVVRPVRSRRVRAFEPGGAFTDPAFADGDVGGQVLRGRRAGRRWGAFICGGGADGGDRDQQQVAWGAQWAGPSGRLAAGEGGRADEHHAGEGGEPGQVVKGRRVSGGPRGGGGDRPHGQAGPIAALVVVLGGVQGTHGRSTSRRRGVPSSTGPAAGGRRSSWESLSWAPARLTRSPSASPSQPSRSACLLYTSPSPR